MENTARLKLESILFRNGVVQKDLEDIFGIIEKAIEDDSSFLKDMGQKRRLLIDYEIESNKPYIYSQTIIEQKVDRIMIKML